MKNIETIISEAGIELTDEQKATINNAVQENYKTVAEVKKVEDKRDEYKISLDDVQSKLDGFKDVDVDDLKGQIETLTGDLQAEKDARVEDARQATLAEQVKEFLSDKQFVNDITAKTIGEQLATELDSDSAKGKSIEDIFKKITSDEDGNVLENVLVTKTEQNKARFTTPAGTLPPAGTKLSGTELMKLKNENPDMDITPYM